jgi:hypothetical protein
MKQLLLTFIIIFTTASGAFAQLDRASGGLSIPRKTKPKAEPKPAPTPEGYVSPFKIDPFKKEYKSNLQVGAEEPQRSIVEQRNDFVTGGSEYQDRVTIKQRGESNEAYKGNRSFGEFRTKSGYVNVMCRDFGAEDGDRIKVSINGKVIIANTTLNFDFNSIMMNLSPGFNLIEIEALNQGTSGPNTAAFEVYDDKGNLIVGNEWNLATGFKATFLIVKEE